MTEIPSQQSWERQWAGDGRGVAVRRWLALPSGRLAAAMSESHPAAPDIFETAASHARWPDSLANPWCESQVGEKKDKRKRAVHFLPVTYRRPSAAHRGAAAPDVAVVVAGTVPILQAFVPADAPSARGPSPATFHGPAGATTDEKTKIIGARRLWPWQSFLCPPTYIGHDLRSRHDRTIGVHGPTQQYILHVARACCYKGVQCAGTDTASPADGTQILT